jgi:hypothetical protein
MLGPAGGLRGMGARYGPMRAGYLAIANDTQRVIGATFVAPGSVNGCEGGLVDEFCDGVGL